MTHTQTDWGDAADTAGALLSARFNGLSQAQAATLETLAGAL